MNTKKILRALYPAVVVVVLFLTALPLFHRHGQFSSNSSCGVCALYNETHAKQTPSHFAFTSFNVTVSSFVTQRDVTASFEDFLTVFLRAPPEPLA